MSDHASMRRYAAALAAEDAALMRELAAAHAAALHGAELLSAKWNVKIIGDMVEFYDARQDPEKFGPLGQFVARYYRKTLLDSEAELSAGGLNLDFGVPSWTVSAADMRTLFVALNASTERNRDA